jgi:hypothetical protein
MKKAELSKDEEFRNKSETKIEAVVASEFYGFSQQMCRQAMIRNMLNMIKWFKATMLDKLSSMMFYPYYYLSRSSSRLIRFASPETSSA